MTIRSYTNDGQLWQGIAGNGWVNVETGQHITDEEFEALQARDIDPRAEESLPEYPERSE